ncbi:MAG: hypothetical protein F6K03_10155, partial [Kamptonema sp. SIO4C4]|nr:hypothetical protein [Kamptonema sp. SIO4C4]
MSQITIQCRLVASEATRRYLWRLMAEQNTPLIRELLQQIGEHPDFETWRQQGKLPKGFIKQRCDALKTNSCYSNQPSRFYSSAIALINYIYKSWFKVQQRLQRQLEGQQRWLSMLKSDEDLIQENNCSLDTLRTQATDILNTLEENKNRTRLLFQRYNQTQDPLTRAAICHLLKNRNKVRQKPENLKKLTERRRKSEIKIQRLQDKLKGRIPKGRDLTGQGWLTTLITAANKAPQDAAEVKAWQDILLTDSKIVPYPVAYETNEDLTWSQNEQGRLCVRFNGLGKHTFKIYCDRRQLPYFQLFWEDRKSVVGSLDVRVV